MVNTESIREMKRYVEYSVVVLQYMYSYIPQRQNYCINPFMVSFSYKAHTVTLGFCSTLQNMSYLHKLMEF